ncbi:MAG: DMT family transporter [Rhodospirillaceae bacterium]|nr:DMT family transporter [Rhodospirillaceae bacterium]MYF85158.1 DMT family transporter [Rhodospirillaceae bacterium]MYH35214.1 DMT family transporter [Rhodospirillaceae bacterium]MYK16018.1 DMT family transporter [Rhodospirillaceae bacterium]
MTDSVEATKQGVVPPQAAHRMDAGDWGLLLSLSGLWGLSYLFQKIGLSELPVFSVVLARVGLAAIPLVVLLYAVGQRLPVAPRLWAGFMLIALLNNVLPFSLIVGGQQWITTGMTALLIGTTPMMSAVLSHLLGGERLTVGRVAGVLIGLAGLVVLVGPEVLGGFTLGLTGQLLTLGAALCYTLAAIYGRRFRHVPPLVLSTGQLVCASLIMLPLAAINDRFWTYPVSGGVWAALLALAVFGTSLGYILYFRLLARAGPTNLLLVTLLVPIGATVTGALFLDEAVTATALVGMALIFLGLAVIDGRLFVRMRRG